MVGKIFYQKVEKVLKKYVAQTITIYVISRFLLPKAISTKLYSEILVEL